MANIGSAPHGLNHEVGLIVQSSTGIRTDKMVELYADPTTHRLLVDAGTVSGAGTIGSTVPTSAEYLGVAVGTILEGLSGKGLGLNVAADVAVVDQNGNQINSLPGALDVNLKQVSPFVTRNGPTFNLKGQKFRFVGFNYYPLIVGSTKAQMQTIMDDAKAKGITVLRTWCFDPYGGFRNLFYQDGTNLVTNPSFETNTTGWTLDADYTRVNTDSEDGTWSIKQVSTTGFAHLYSNSITVTPSTNYVLTFYYKMSNPSGAAPVLFIEDGTRANTIKDCGFLNDTAGLWVKKQVTFNSGIYSSVAIDFFNFNGAATAFYDNIHLSVQAGSPHLEYYEPSMIQIDTALDEARKRGIKLILSLADGNENNYNTKGQYVTWANAINSAGLTNSYPYIGFFQSTYCKNPYKDFINTLVKRKNTINGIQYKDDPVIFSWELGNELRVNNFDPGNTVNTLQSGNLALLSSSGGWADEMSSYIKSIDPNHLVGFGDMGHSWQYLQDNSAVGDVVYNGTFYGVDYGILSALPNIDYLDVHLYPTQDDGIHLAAGGGKYWGQKFGYNNGVSGDGLRAQLKDYVTTAHANNKPALITEVGFLQGTTGDNTYYPLYNRYNAFQAIFKDFLDIPNGDGVVIWHAVAAASSASYDVALEATGGAGVTDNSNDTDILTLINTYNTAFLTDVTPSQAVTGLIKVSGDIVSKNLNFNDSTVSIQLSDTWTGTVQFEYTIDGITWYSLSLKDNTGTAVTSATAVGLFTGAIAGMNKVRVRASAAITGSLTVNIQSSTGVNASVASGGGGGGTQYVDAAASVVHPTGNALVFDNGSSAWQAVNSTHGLPVNIIAGAGSGGTALADNAAFTAGTTNLTPAGGFFHSTIDAVTDGHAAALAIDAKRNLFTVLRDAAGNARGANINASNQLSVSIDNNPVLGAGSNIIGTVSLQEDNVTNIDGRGNVVNVLADSALAPLTVITYPFIFNGTSWDRPRGDTTSGLWVNVKSQAALPAGTNVIGHVIVDTAPSTAVTNVGTFAVQATPVTQADTFMLGGVNIKEINAVTPLMGNGTTGTGSLRVTIASDNTVLPGVGAGATGAAVPANASYDGGIAKTSLPTAATDGNLTGKMVDKFGRQVMLPTTIRDLIGTQTTTISASTAETTIVTAGGAGIFNDLLLLIISNTSASTTTRIDFRDTTGGSILFSLFSPGGDTRGFNIGGIAIPQTSTATNWTAQCATSTTDIRIYAVFAKNK